jgi:hypothetical protein
MVFTMALPKMVALLMGIASLASNPSIITNTGTRIPPPPTPAPAATQTATATHAAAIQSAAFSGKSGLWCPSSSARAATDTAVLHSNRAMHAVAFHTRFPIAAAFVYCGLRAQMEEQLFGPKQLVAVSRGRQRVRKQTAWRTQWKVHIRTCFCS